MEEELLIRSCAPTLAGLKTGSLFTCPCHNRDSLLKAIRSLNQKFVKKGLRLLPLRFTENKALIYLYRPGKLRKDLRQQTAASVLRCHGYNPERCEHCVKRLACKLRTEAAFPHEIGLFLGYPPEDVEGFITKGPDQCKFTGCWKVYGDAEAARKKFAQYKKCTRVYCQQHAKGAQLERLAVSTQSS